MGLDIDMVRILDKFAKQKCLERPSKIQELKLEKRFAVSEIIDYFDNYTWG
jgi:hypothetical protein